MKSNADNVFGRIAKWIFLMRLRNRIALVVLALFAMWACVVVFFMVFQTPHMLTERFVGHMSRSRYKEAAAMLREPCEIRITFDGNLEVVDAKGRLTIVPARRLPFRSGGGRPGKECDFSMAAIQGAVNGLLDDPGGFVAYFSIDRGKVRIDSVD